jgi:hypothetical protein
MQQIADWLKTLGMSEYAERFAENKIDVSTKLRTLGDQPAVGRRLLSSRWTRRTALKGNLMAEPEVEGAWGAEFKRIGEKQFRDALNGGVGIADEPTRQAAFRWLGDEG